MGEERSAAMSVPSPPLWSTEPRSTLVTISRCTPVSWSIFNTRRTSRACFPEGSDFPETDAKEEIWDLTQGAFWDHFKEYAQDTKDAAQALHAAVEAGEENQYATGFRDLGQTCKACHDDFRRE